MSIWAIADIHASRTDPLTEQPSKPMDVFGPQWKDHVERLEQSWNRHVAADDVVIVAGDIDWALYLDDAMETLERLDAWSGTKILLRGNHDYWWSSKVTSKVRKRLPPTLRLLHNDALQAEGFNICGAKGSPVPGAIDWTQENAKLLNREVQRLRFSLEHRDDTLPTIVALHYPPFFPSQGRSLYRDVLEESEVGMCVYGHLHGASAASGPHGVVGGVYYRLVAADATDFCPVLVAGDGRTGAHTGGSVTIDSEG
ncbi:MAG: metallophosphoesterase [Chloroflexota bacterium]